jgi:hypothetical protein
MLAKRYLKVQITGMELNAILLDQSWGHKVVNITLILYCRMMKLGFSALLESSSHLSFNPPKIKSASFVNLKIQYLGSYTF